MRFRQWTAAVLLLAVLAAVFSAGYAEETKKATVFRSAGNIVTLGRYEQDNNAGNGPEPIEWIILDMSDTTYVSNTFAEMMVQLQIRMERTEFESMPIQNMPQEIYRFLKERGCITSLDYELKEE